MFWWKVHSKCGRCTIFLRILRFNYMFCIWEEAEGILRALTVGSECYIIWWEKWQWRQDLRNHLSSTFIFMGTIYLLILPHLLTLFPVLILVVIFFFIHAFRYKQIEIFDIVFVFVWFYFCTTQILTFWQLTITIIWIPYTYSMYIYFFDV